MTSVAETLTVQSPRQADSTPGLQAPGETAWIEQFAGMAVSHMAASGVMTLKHAIEYLREQDSKYPEQEKRG